MCLTSVTLPYFRFISFHKSGRLKEIIFGDPQANRVTHQVFGAQIPLNLWVFLTCLIKMSLLNLFCYHRIPNQIVLCTKKFDLSHCIIGGASFGEYIYR